VIGMGSFSAWHWVVVALVVLILFGRGKISETMGDFGKGIRSFKKGGSEVEYTSPLEPAEHLPAVGQTPAE
jgi:sec-independent protein translocase protein TatA